jgi:WD40 repeat protein
MLVSGGDDGAIMLWDRRNPIGLGQYLHEAGPVQFASDGSAKASGKWPPPPPPCGERCDPATIVAASPDGTLTAGIDPEDPGIALVRRKGGGEPVQVGYPANITALAFHPSGKILAIGGADKKVLFQDPQSGKALTDQPALTVYQSTILSLAYSPDGNLLASADGDSELTDMSLDTDTNEHAVFIWDMRTHLLLGPPIRNFRDWYIQVKFSPDGQRLAAWSGDGSFILDLSPAKLMDSLCQLANRNLTVAEWRQYVGTLPYSKTCPAFPPGR